MEFHKVSIRHALHILTNLLVQANSDAPYVCARVLLARALGVNALHLATHPLDIVDTTAWAHAQSLCNRHACGEPLAYIVGEKEFYGRTFCVNSHTLIPRPESEDVVDTLFQHVKKNAARFIDIGTGSGCLAVTLAAERPQWQGLMLDKSTEALNVAVKNAYSMRVAARLMAIGGDLNCLPLARESVDIVISNPPYVSSTEYTCLAKGVRDFEPMTAFVPMGHDIQLSRDGLEHLKAIARQSYDVLRMGGVCVVEHGWRQGALVRKMFLEYGKWSSVKTYKDMSNLERICLCEKK